MKETNRDRINKDLPGSQALTRQYDPLEKILAERPLEKAPADSSRRVLARIAALSAQKATVVDTLAASQLSNQVEAANPAKLYTPPQALPLPEIEGEEAPFYQNLYFYFFAMGWIGLCLGISYLLWNVITGFVNSNYDFWAIAVSFRDGAISLTDGLLKFTASSAPYLASCASMLMGLCILMYFVQLQPNRAWQE